MKTAHIKDARPRAVKAVGSEQAMVARQFQNPFIVLSLYVSLVPLHKCIWTNRGVCKLNSGVFNVPNYNFLDSFGLKYPKEHFYQAFPLLHSFTNKLFNEICD